MHLDYIPRFERPTISTYGLWVSTNGGDLALSTGAVVNVPLFISIGEVVKVDTRSGEYVSRVKSS